MDDGLREIQDIVFSGSKEEGEVIEQKPAGADGEEEKGLALGVFRGKEEDEQESECGDKEEKEGGFIENIISSLVSPVMSPRPKEGPSERGIFGVRDAERSHNESAVKQEDDKESDGCSGHPGIIGNVISNIFHRSHEEGGGGDEKDSSDREEGKGPKDEEVRAAEGGLLDSIVSQWPTPIADDAAPGADEASILIHSIVHD